MRIWKKYRDSSFVLKMSIAFLLGLFVALIFREHAELLNPLGVLLIRLLSLIAIPVIFLTVVLAVNKMNISQYRKSTRLNSSHVAISYAVFCFKQKNCI